MSNPVASQALFFSCFSPSPRPFKAHQLVKLSQAGIEQWNGKWEGKFKVDRKAVQDRMSCSHQSKEEGKEGIVYINIVALVLLAQSGAS